MSTVQIGQAAALYHLAPSTLRWWEQQGVLGTPPRGGGRRQYGAQELRQIGMAYLCHVNGKLPLDTTARIAGEGGGCLERQATIRHRIAELGEQIEHLQAAQQYLHHLLRCTDDDLSRCPYLDGELIARTPRGRYPDPDILAAAQHLQRAEVVAPPQPAHRCDSCTTALSANNHSRGRRRRYCSRACQQRAYRDRVRHRTQDVTATAV